LWTVAEPEVMAGLLAGVHRDPLPAPLPVHPGYWEPVSADRWTAAAGRLASAGAPFAAEFAQFAGWQLDLQRWSAEPDSVQMCHRDLWLDNLRTTPDGRLCVIDWDNCGAADPGQELAVTLYEQCADDPGRAARLVAAYRRQGGTGRLSGPQSFTMAVAQLSHFAITAAERWLEDDDPAQRRRMEAWFREGYDEPLTPALIDALLRACGS
jgi:aminoglycoside phosphotransferase (APT) family kinase protein